MSATKQSPRRTRRTDEPRRDLYTEVTNRVINALEQGTAPWRRPWKMKRNAIDARFTHVNLQSRKVYRGINTLLLSMTAMEQGYVEPYWVTFKQAIALGGCVRKGEKSTLIVFWKQIIIETEERNAQGQKIKKRIPLLRHYNVFNVEQCDGLEGKVPQVEPVEDEPVFTPIETAQAIIDQMPNRPVTHHRGSRAFYSPLDDQVTLPEAQDFTSEQEYYSTAYHEYVHSTAHASRLGRVQDWTAFGSDTYAKEELVAEMGAAFLCAIADIDVAPLRTNSEAYCGNWIKVLEGDPKFLVQAASHAQKASEYILNVSHENGEES